MSDIPDCRKCGEPLELMDSQWWRCENSDCVMFRVSVIPAADDIEAAERMFARDR